MFGFCSGHQHGCVSQVAPMVEARRSRGCTAGSPHMSSASLRCSLLSCSHSRLVPPHCPQKGNDCPARNLGGHAHVALSLASAPPPISACLVCPGHLIHKASTAHSLRCSQGPSSSAPAAFFSVGRAEGCVLTLPCQ